jgi:hypothetical protein
MDRHIELSVLRDQHYRMTAHCSDVQQCGYTSQIDLSEAIAQYGNISLAELRGLVRCPLCRASVTTSLVRAPSLPQRGLRMHM